jgi:hypothetical protein
MNSELMPTFTDVNELCSPFLRRTYLLNIMKKSLYRWFLFFS